MVSSSKFAFFSLAVILSFPLSSRADDNTGWSIAANTVGGVVTGLTSKMFYDRWRAAQNSVVTLRNRITALQAQIDAHKAVGSTDPDDVSNEIQALKDRLPELEGKVAKARVAYDTNQRLISESAARTPKPQPAGQPVSHTNSDTMESEGFGSADEVVKRTVTVKVVRTTIPRAVPLTPEQAERARHEAKLQEGFAQAQGEANSKLSEANREIATINDQIKEVNARVAKAQNLGEQLDTAEKDAAVAENGIKGPAVGFGVLGVASVLTSGYAAYNFEKALAPTVAAPPK